MKGSPPPPRTPSTKTNVQGIAGHYFEFHDLLHAKANRFGCLRERLVARTESFRWLEIFLSLEVYVNFGFLALQPPSSQPCLWIIIPVMGGRRRWAEISLFHKVITPLAVFTPFIPLAQLLFFSLSVKRSHERGGNEDLPIGKLMAKLPIIGPFWKSFQF